MTLCLVTVCFNNPEELRKTVSSVKQQTVHPDKYIIVDSSDESTKPVMEEIAESANAEYKWVSPEGVYEAMRFSVGLAPDDCWVWWLNSSDWLAGTRSVEIVRDTIADKPVTTGYHWVIGELLRVHGGRYSAHKTGASGGEFLHLIRSGRIGFPHPSTIFYKPSLANVGPYEDGLSIASDYGTALRFARSFGAPLIIPNTLSVHDPTGLTSRHPLRNLWEKSLARRRMSGILSGFAELWRVPTSLIRGLWTRAAGEKWVSPLGKRAANYPLWGNQPLHGV